MKVNQGDTSLYYSKKEGVFCSFFFSLLLAVKRKKKSRRNTTPDKSLVREGIEDTIELDSVRFPLSAPGDKDTISSMILRLLLKVFIEIHTAQQRLFSSHTNWKLFSL